MNTSATKAFPAAVVAAFLLAGCGQQTVASDAGTASATSSASPKASTSEAASPAPEEQGDEAELTVGERERMRAAREAEEKRRKAAPSGDPAAGKTEIPGPRDYGFGEVAATRSDGEVLVFEIRQAGGMVMVPVTITNQGSARAFYTVDITVGLPSGKTVTKTIETAVTGVHPGSTWPQQVKVTEDGDADTSRYTLKGVEVKRDIR